MSKKLARHELTFKKGHPVYSSNLDINSMPILAVYLEKELSLEIGLNVPHIHKLPCAFTNLASNSEKSLNTNNYQQVLYHVKKIMLEDSAVSNYQLSHLNRFRIHTCDSGLIKLLEEDEKSFSDFRLMKKIQKSKTTPYEKILEQVSLNLGLYKTILSGLEPYNRERFHTILSQSLKTSINEFDAQMDAYRDNEKEREEVSNAVKDLKRCRANIGDSHYIRQALKPLLAREKELAKPKKAKITLQNLDEVFQDFISNPFTYKEKELNFNGFGNIAEMKTKLHNYNKGYSSDILTFVLSESGKDYKKRHNVFTQLQEKYGN